MNFLKRIAIAAPIYIVAVLVVYMAAPSVFDEVRVHSWGWLVLLGCYAAMAFINGVLIGAVELALEVRSLVTDDNAHIIEEVVDYIFTGFAFFVAAWFAPSYVSAGHFMPCMIACVVFGLASGVYDVIAHNRGLHSYTDS